MVYFLIFRGFKMHSYNWQHWTKDSKPFSFPTFVRASFRDIPQSRCIYNISDLQIISPTHEYIHEQCFFSFCHLHLFYILMVHYKDICTSFEDLSHSANSLSLSLFGNTEKERERKTDRETKRPSSSN